MADPYDNAFAEPLIGLHKTEVIREHGPWRGVDPVEYATLEWGDWFNTRRLVEPIGNVPPVEYERAYHQHNVSRNPGTVHSLQCEFALAFL